MNEVLNSIWNHIDCMAHIWDLLYNCSALMVEVRKRDAHWTEPFIIMFVIA